jgi:hypothetical protein
MWNDKSDWYPIPARNPTGTGMNFYPWVRVQISTHSLFADGQVIAPPDPLPSLVGVGNELSQQLGLLVVGLKDQGDRLSQTWRWRQIPVPLGVLGPISHVASVHHSATQTCYH